MYEILQHKSIIYFLLIFLSLKSQPLFASGIIKGIVTDTQTKEPLAWVNISINGTRLGTATNEKGEYTIENIPSGVYQVVFRMIGYKIKMVRRVRVQSDKTTIINETLTALPLEMEMVSVTADREKPMAEQLAPSVRSIKARDVESLAGGVEDLFRAIQSLPGVSARSDLSSQFYVRGGTPDQNLIIVDNVPVFNPYRLKVFGGPISMFNPDIIDYIELLPGGFPAEYGDKMSAVLVVNNKEGSRFNHHLKMSGSLIDMKAFAEGPVPLAGENGSWLFSLRRTYYDLLFNQLNTLPAGTILPFFRDYQGKLVYDLAPDQKLIFNFFDSKEGMRLKDLEVDEGDQDEFFKEEDKFNFSSTINNRLFSTGWINAINGVTLSNLTLSHLKDTWDLSIENINEKYNPEIDMRKLEIKEDLTHRISPGQTLQGGLILTDYITDITVKLDVDSSIYYADNPDDRQEGDKAHVIRNFRLQNASTTFGLYLQDEWKILPKKFSALPGLRADYSTFTREWVVSPRLSCLYQIRQNIVLRGGWGYYYQAPNFVSLFERYEREIEWNLFETIKLNTEKSIHYIAGIEWQPAQQYTAKCELYYKDLSRLVIPTDSTRNYIPNNNGTGYIYGFEVFLHKKQVSDGVFSGWLSYSYSLSKEKDPSTIWHFRDFDLRHSFNAVARYSPFRNYFIDCQYKAASGFPRTPVVRDQQNNPQFNENGDVIKGKINSERYPGYQRLDIRFTLSRKVLGYADFLFYLEIINVLNRKNIYQYYWSEDYRTRFTSYMLPRMPFFGVKLEM